jgi:ATP-dependent exoDNAse (exonuclease V) alpha subunit
MLKKNINVDIGLCNGAIGHIQAINYTQRNILPTVDVEFNENVGMHTINPTSVEFNLMEGNGMCTRTMLPLMPAYALTVHKLQGSTLDYAVIDLGANYFAPAQKFVALSRCKSLDTLIISDLDASRLIGPNVCNQEALDVIRKLRRKCNLIN